jgi:hypothetical protein
MVPGWVTALFVGVTMNENEKLRSRIAELEKQLVEAKPRSVLELELRRRGLAADRVEDAVLLLGAEHEPATPESLTTEAVWRTKGDATLRTITEVIDGFQESRSYLFPATHRAEVTYTAPVYSDGRLVPVSEMTGDELAAAAGSTPYAQPAKLPVYTPEQLDAMSDLERSIARASAAPAPEQPGLSYEGVPSIEESHAEMKLKEELRKETVASMKQGGMKIDPPVRKLGKQW